jgi:formamidopyrimidine-DNA glycosylase
MPELPEVHTIVRALRPRLVGRRVVGFESRWPPQAMPDVRTVRDGIVDRAIRDLTRRGKFIVFSLNDGGFLLVHLRMSGRLEWSLPRADPPSRATEPSPAREPSRAVEPPHVRAVWKLDDGRRLLLCDARKFGRIVYTRDLQAATSGLGAEPLSPAFTPLRLARLLHARARQLKPLLLDQSVIAGLGNIYTDEALFRAGLHPATRSDRLRTEQIATLHGAIRQVLRAAIRRNGTSFDWIYPGGRMQDHLLVYGRAGEPCRRCGATIRAIRVAQRGTHVCPRCQRLRRRGNADNAE